MAKTKSVTALKLIHICVDYSAKMETILAEMWALFVARNCFFRGSPVSLEKVPDLTEFPDLPPTEVLQNLQTPTTLKTNQESTESRERKTPESDARTNEAGKTQLEEVPTLASIPTIVPETPVSVPTTVFETLPLPADLASVISSTPAPSHVQGCLTRRTWRFGRRFRTRTNGHTYPSVLFRRTSICKKIFTNFFFHYG